MTMYDAIGIPVPDIDQVRVSRWIQEVAASYGKKTGDIHYVFVDDEEILRMNRQFIGHDYYTDHIGFDYTQGTFLSGDIYISVDTVRSNAVCFNVPYEQELHRVIIHGILHLCGIEDKEPQQRAEMEAAENKALAIWKTLT